MKNKKLHCGIAGITMLALTAPALATQLRVTFTNLSPDGGVYVTPVWVGFHNGSFDSYDGGTASAPALERLAEDGNTAPISAVFAQDTDGTTSSGTLVDTGTAQLGANRRQATLGGGPIGPGGSVSEVFDVDVSEGGENQYFSYASMILPTSDYYIANGNATAHNLVSLATNNGVVEFFVGIPNTVNDAGTEINDFATSAGNGLFPGLPQGQTGPNQGADENGVNTNVLDAFANFDNVPAGFDLSLLNFNDASVYNRGGIGVIRIETVPVPASLVLMLVGLGFAGFKRRK